MAEEWVFHFRVNGGKEQQITSKSSVYRDVAAAIPAMFGVSIHQTTHIEIWYPENLPEYGPYNYLIYEDMYGALRVVTASKWSTPQ